MSRIITIAFGYFVFYVPLLCPFDCFYCFLWYAKDGIDLKLETFPSLHEEIPPATL